ncbi:275_t:CDS:2, partial [Ambispora leptoticha]
EQITNLQQEVQYYQTLYENRVKKDLGLEEVEDEELSRLLEETNAEMEKLKDEIQELKELNDKLAEQNQEIENLSTSKNSAIQTADDQLKIQHQEQLRKINLLFDEKAKDYETIDFNGLYSLLVKVKESSKNLDIMTDKEEIIKGLEEKVKELTTENERLKEEVNKFKMEEEAETEKKEEVELKMEPETIKFLDEDYPKEKRGSVEAIDIDYSNFKGHLDLREFVNLKKLSCKLNQLTSIDLSKNVNLKELDCFYNQLTSLDLYCYNNKLTSLDVSHNPKLTDLYCDAELFIENKITGLEKTSIIRLDCRGGDLLQKNISDLNELVSQVNQATIQDEEFLKKIFPKGIEINKRTYYRILDQIANTILARCLIIQNRLYDGKDEEYEKRLENLTQE